MVRKREIILLNIFFTCKVYVLFVIGYDVTFHGLLRRASSAVKEWRLLSQSSFFCALSAPWPATKNEGITSSEAIPREVKFAVSVMTFNRNFSICCINLHHH